MSSSDDHDGVIGDWFPLTPSPRTLFSAVLGSDDIRVKSLSKNPTGDNQNENLFWGVGGQNLEDKKVSTQMCFSHEPKLNSRSGLVERIAARSGFNAPRLNTENIKFIDLSLTQDVRSPYLTIPSGLSPTTLLESPVFLSNSLAEPSPTTGKFTFLPNGNSRTSGLTSDLTYAQSRREDNLFEEINTSTFAFKPVPESGSSFSLGTASKISQLMRPQNQQCFLRTEVSIQSENSNSNNTIMVDTHAFDTSHAQQEGDQQTDLGSFVGSPSEDGYNWRKYGQKQVKGSEFPRSYYKCTHSNCQVKKKVERSHEGHITEIIYKGAHSHPTPQLNRRSSNMPSDMQLDTILEQNGTGDNHEATSSSSLHARHGASQLESGEAIEASSTFSNEEDEDDRGTHGSTSLGYDVEEEDESESKRRKIETYATDVSGASRAIREPRVVVQTTSEVDILDDGYRWRKYGQKVVKGNPNPRSYYKCTNSGCMVRKHVERASNDLKSVITTYEGKHNHDVPEARNSSHVSTSSQSQAAQLHMGTFAMRGPLGLSHGFPFGMCQSNLVNLAMPVNPFLGQQRQVSEFGFMLPKEEAKVEPASDFGSWSIGLPANYKP